MSDKIYFKRASDAKEVSVVNGQYRRIFERAREPFDLHAEHGDLERRLYASHDQLEIRAEDGRLTTDPNSEIPGVVETAPSGAASLGEQAGHFDEPAHARDIPFSLPGPKRGR